MKLFKLTFTFAFFFFFLHSSIAQSYPPITGKVINPQNEPLEFVSVALLNPKDSTMINFTTTDIKGDFKIIETSKDSILIQLFSTGYLPYFKTIVYKNELIDLKTITLDENISMLDEVVISAVIPVEIKKDTIAFNTNSFKINFDDTIEELLKKLPGIELEPGGKIIAHGNEVTKIYVDGKEFFGGDPAIVLKNLPADAIAKVEVIDKKSNESELTGISDGNKQIVINFSLKKNKKKQGFGKTASGIGLDKHYFSNLNYNKFSSKTQLSVIGKFNNINVTGSNIQDFLQNSNGLGDESDDKDDNTKNKKLSGFLTTAVAGINFGHEFKKREFFNIDYFYNQLQNNGTTNSERTTFSNRNNYQSLFKNNFDNKSNNHNLNFNYKNQSRKNSSLYIRGKLIKNDRVSNTNKNGTYLNELSEHTATNINQLQNKNDKNYGDFKLNYYQKLNKAGRNFNTNFYTSISKTTRNNNQEAEITRNISKPNESKKEIFTLRDEKFHNYLQNFNFKYTEPLGKNHYLKVETSAVLKKTTENVKQSKITHSKSTSEEFLNYQYTHLENNFYSKIAHSYNTNKLNIYTGIQLQDHNRNFGELFALNLKKNNLYINPIITLRFNPKKGRKYKLDYKKSILSPRSSQSTTIVNDLNPYSIRKGNPNLKPEKNETLNLSINIHNFASSLNFNTRIQLQHTNDAIIPSVEIDDNFIKTKSFENKGSRQRLNTSTSFSKKINGLGIRYTLKNKNTFSTSNSIINFQLNDVVSNSFMINTSIENYKKRKFDLKTGASYSVNNTKFSLVKDFNRRYMVQKYFAMLDLDMYSKLNFNTQFDYFIHTDNRFTSVQKLPLWNASLSYALSKKKNKILKLVLIDLLDKNIDINKKSTINYFEEVTTKSLGRYIILSYTYRLNKQQKKRKRTKRKATKNAAA